MRFFSLADRPMTRILLIESGSREIIEALLPVLRENWGGVPVDLVTCFGGAPRGLPADAKIYRVTDYASGERRNELIASLRANGYSNCGVICSAESIMNKWKWLIAFRLPAKLFVINENGDFFWADRSNIPLIRHFVLFRMGLTGAGAVRTLFRLISFPFSLLFLLLYAGIAHARRALRLAFQPKNA